MPKIDGLQLRPVGGLLLFLEHPTLMTLELEQ